MSARSRCADVTADLAARAAEVEARPKELQDFMAFQVLLLCTHIGIAIVYTYRYMGRCTGGYISRYTISHMLVIWGRA